MNKREAQELETSEKRDRGMIGTSEEGEGDDRNERRGRGGSESFRLAFFNS